jgi:O-antigen/teichoic acid export membrane protein
LTLFTVYGTVAETYASIRNRITVPRLIKDVIQRLGLTAAAVGIGAAWIGFEQAVMLVVLVYGATTILNLGYLRSLGRIHLRPDFSGIDKGLVRDYLSYTGLVLAGSLGGMLLSRVDFIMVTSMQGIAATGIYSTAFYMAMVIDIPKRAIQQISAPIVSEGLHRGDHALVLDLYRKSSINQLLFGSLLFLGIWVNLDTIFDWMPNGDVYRSGAMVFFFIGVSRLLDLSAGIGGVILYNSDYYTYSVPMGFITTGVAIAGNLLLIPIMGIGGAAAATALSYLLLVLYILGVVRWKSGMHPFTRETWILVLLLAIALAAHQAYGAQTGAWTDLVFNTALFWIPFAATCLILRISPDIHTLLRNTLRP